MKELIETTNLYYFHSILEIGGIETFFYYLAKKYKDWDLTIVYREGNVKQLERLRDYVSCIQYQPGMKCKCTRAFFNFNTDIIDEVTATDGYYLVLHGDYEDMLNRKQLLRENFPGHRKITNYVGISKQVCEAWEIVTGKKAELCYNPFMPDKPHKKLKLISATRLSVEKGGNRMIKLGEALDKLGVDYEWDIYSNRGINQKLSPHMHLKSTKLNIIDDIAQADFLVQLSDNEGYCYSIVEALNLGVPVVVTPIPVFKEIGLDDTNSITLEFDCSNVMAVAEQIANKNFFFKYTPIEDSWDKLLIPGPSKYQKELNTKYLVKATEEYGRYHIKDKELGFRPEPGHKWQVSKIRYDYLNGGNQWKAKFVELVEKIPPEEQEEMSI